MVAERTAGRPHMRGIVLPDPGIHGLPAGISKPADREGDLPAAPLEDFERPPSSVLAQSSLQTPDWTASGPTSRPHAPIRMHTHMIPYKACMAEISKASNTVSGLTECAQPWNQGFPSCPQPAQNTMNPAPLSSFHGGHGRILVKISRRAAHFGLLSRCSR